MLKNISIDGHNKNALIFHPNAIYLLALFDTQLDEKMFYGQNYTALCTS